MSSEVGGVVLEEKIQVNQCFPVPPGDISYGALQAHSGCCAVTDDPPLAAVEENLWVFVDVLDHPGSVPFVVSSLISFLDVCPFERDLQCVCCSNCIFPGDEVRSKQNSVCFRPCLKLISASFESTPNRYFVIVSAVCLPVLVCLPESLAVY